MNKRLIFSLVLALLLAGCTTETEEKETAAGAAPVSAFAVPEPDYWPTREWKTADPEERGMNADELKSIEESLSSKPIRSMLVVKDGYIVSEYYKEGDSGTAYKINSVTKSITSALVGIAIDQGRIGGVDDLVMDYFPEIAKEETDAEKKKMTIAHLLSMTSGLDWPEWSEWNYSFDPMLQSPDWPGFVLQRPMERTPGEVFNYNTGGSQVLAAILKKQTGLSEAEYARKNLFEPIGMAGNPPWYESPDDTNTGGFGLKMTARDQARFGFLYLHGGKWDGKQIVPEKWVVDSTSVHSDGHFLFGEYGYHWWVGFQGDEKIFDAMGYAGQYIYVVPALNLVAVFSSDSPTDTTIPQPIFAQVMGAVRKG